MYSVILTARAEAELRQQYDWWTENRSPEQAKRWYVGFLKKLLRLEKNPRSGLLARENDLFPCQVYQLNYGLSRKLTHRALYTFREGKVVVLRIRHLRQAFLTEDDLM